jgi:hypothetical protein
MVESKSKTEKELRESVRKILMEDEMIELIRLRLGAQEPKRGFELPWRK